MEIDGGVFTEVDGEYFATLMNLRAELADVLGSGRFRWYCDRNGEMIGRVDRYTGKHEVKEGLL